MKHLCWFKVILSVFLLFVILQSNAQDPKRFQKAVEELVKKEYNFSPDKEVVVFAGSSSIRMWKDVQAAYPEYNVINNGFGGSHFSDLIHYYRELIAIRRPDILFIYEGDNDIFSGKNPKKVADEARQLINKVHQDFPETKIVLISAKPSLARWKLKKEYQQLNRYLEKLAKKREGLEYADVWKAMVDERGDVYTDIFVDDNLHLNEKGYEIWEEVIGKFLK